MYFFSWFKDGRSQSSLEISIGEFRGGPPPPSSSEGPPWRLVGAGIIRGNTVCKQSCHERSHRQFPSFFSESIEAVGYEPFLEIARNWPMVLQDWDGSEFEALRSSGAARRNINEAILVSSFVYLDEIDVSHNVIYVSYKLKLQAKKMWKCGKMTILSFFIHGVSSKIIIFSRITIVESTSFNPKNFIHM